jgi:hypothetical protein
VSEPRPAPLLPLSLVASGLGLVYSLYRGYYALGGTLGMIGVPAPSTPWRLINGVAAIGLLVAAAVPLVAIPLWRRPVARPILIALFSIAAVGLVMHGLIDETQRTLHLLGLAERLHIDVRLAGWRSVDLRAADLQDVFLNEPWFILEGLACGALVWVSLRARAARRWWLAAVLVATAALTAMGLLTVTGVRPRTIVF